MAACSPLLPDNCRLELLHRYLFIFSSTVGTWIMKMGEEAGRPRAWVDRENCAGFMKDSEQVHARNKQVEHKTCVYVCYTKAHRLQGSAAGALPQAPPREQGLLFPRLSPRCRR